MFTFKQCCINLSMPLFISLLVYVNPMFVYKVNERQRRCLLYMCMSISRTT